MSTERETRYAEALRRADDEALEGTNFGRLTATYDEAARAVMAVADEERAADRAEIERLRAKIRAVEALHEMVIEMGVRPWCEADGRAWPCPTVAALSDPSADHRVIDVDMTGLNGKAL